MLGNCNSEFIKIVMKLYKNTHLYVLCACVYINFIMALSGPLLLYVHQLFKCSMNQHQSIMLTCKQLFLIAGIMNPSLGRSNINLLKSYGQHKAGLYAHTIYLIPL